MSKKYSFGAIPQFTRAASYAVNVSWSYLEHHIREAQDKSYGAILDLDPDFQRAHVWSDEQQCRYVEFILRGGKSSRDLYFNCNGWMGSFKGPYVIVDGKQRLEAVRKFMRNELAIFNNNLLGNKNSLKFADFAGPLGISHADFIWHVNDLKTRAEVLQWYLDINQGGVVHTKDEIMKVHKLLEVELKK